jgi:hypothetical protein
MKILTEEVALRDETRATQQAKPQMKKEKHREAAKAFTVTQQGLTDRTDTVIEKIIDLPDGEQDFKKEIAQLTNAANAMNDAEEILDSLDTGPEAIAAETEAIEWLLMAKRAGSGGGGGGGDPGAGSRSGAATSASALALLGQSKEKKAKVQDRETNQATGKSGRDLPEEFRAGLDRYFEVLEGNKQ